MSATASAGERDRPVVVELFTSQGCNSCPPADALLGELAREPGIVALGLHVDYWDYIGWKDPFAQRAYTERQRAYSRALSLRYVYTPQMVIDGAWQGVGSNRAAIRQLIDAARQRRDDGPALAIQGDGAQRIVSVAGGANVAPATIWLALFESRRKTAVAAGENRGRHLANYNVVRELKPIGAWSGAPAEFRLDLAGMPPDCDGGAILVQAGDAGLILAALPLDLRR